MAAIGPISGITPPIGSSQIGKVSAPNNKQTSADFADTLRDYVSNVDGKQQEATVAIQDLVSGRSTNILPVVSAVADADMSFKLLVGVRNKVIEAYKQTMNMQI